MRAKQWVLLRVDCFPLSFQGGSMQGEEGGAMMYLTETRFETIDTFDGIGYSTLNNWKIPTLLYIIKIK